MTYVGSDGNPMGIRIPSGVPLPAPEPADS